MSIRVKVDVPGIGALLNSPELRDDLTARAARVEAQVTGANLDDRTEVRVEQLTHDRAVVRVVCEGPRALWQETQYGWLARALDAAR